MPPLSMLPVQPGLPLTSQSGVMAVALCCSPCCPHGLYLSPIAGWGPLKCKSYHPLLCSQLRHLMSYPSPHSSHPCGHQRDILRVSGPLYMLDPMPGHFPSDLFRASTPFSSSLWPPQIKQPLPTLHLPPSLSPLSYSPRACIMGHSATCSLLEEVLHRDTALGGFWAILLCARASASMS